MLFALIATALLVIPIAFTLQANQNSSTFAALRRDTNALSILLANDLSHNRVSQAIRLSNSYARTTGREVLVLAQSGTLIASKGTQGHDDLLTQIGLSVGHHQKAGFIPRTPVEGPQYYVAMRLPHASNPAKSINHVVLIVTYPVTVVTKTIHSDWRNLGLYGAVMLAIAYILGFLLSNSLTRPLRRISSAVDAIGGGQLGVRAPVDEGPPELRRLAQAINSTSARLINLLEAQKTFVEDASHQLRTPLTALQLHLENIQYGETDLAVEDFQSVLSEVGRLNHLVDSLVALARNESRDPLLEVVDLAAVTEERVTFWRPFAEEQDLKLEISASPGLETFAISGVLEQILDNLLSNAFDATPAGGRIRVEAFASSDATVEIHVIDSGPGLQPSERELALRRFWRGRDNTSDGSGLGLAIVDQLVRLSGGSIELRAATTHGLDATVLLHRA